MPGPQYGLQNHYYGSPDINGHYCSYGHNKVGSMFKKRNERIDWRKLAAVDVERISQDLDFTVLQENITNITFCNIELEVDTRTVDPNFVKLFKLSQLTIEYLLHSQDYLTAELQAVEKKLDKAKEENEDTKKALEKKIIELADVKKECHKRKKLLVEVQQIMQVGPDNYMKCPHCDKSFINMSFLNNHLQRRHGDLLSIAIQQSQGDSQAVSTQVNATLELDLTNIKQRLRLTESQLQQERTVLQERSVKEQEELAHRDEENREELAQWKQEQMDYHKKEMESVRNMFMKELKEVNEKYRASERSLLNIQKRVGKTSNLGILKDDIDYDKELLDQQRAEVAMLKEQLTSQVNNVESSMASKFEDQEKKWKSKLKQLNEQHRAEIEKMNEALEGSLASQRESLQNRQQEDVVKSKKQLDKLQKSAEKDRLQSERRLQEMEQQLTEMASRPPVVAPRKPPVSPTPEKSAEASPMKPSRLEQKSAKLEQKTAKLDQKPAELEQKPAILEQKPAVPAREPEIPLQQATVPKESIRIDVPTIVEQPPSNDEKSEESEEETSSDLSVSSLATTSKTGKDSVDFGTGTATSFGTGTGELSLTTKSDRLMEALKNNPNLIKGMRVEVQDILNQALEKRGISSSAPGVTNLVFQNKMSLLKTERQQKAKKHSNLYEIRQQYIKQVDELAKEKLNSKKTGGDSSSMPANLQSTPKTESKLTPKTPSYTTPKASSTPKNTAQQSQGVSKPAPRTDTSKGAGMSQTFSSAGTASSQWNTDDLSFSAESESENTLEEKGDMPKKEPASPKTQMQRQQINDDDDYDDDDDDDDEEGDKSEWDSEISELDEISPSKTAAGKQSKQYTAPRPKGAIVAELTKSIEMQLTGRNKDKKLAGSVNLAAPLNTGRDSGSPVTPDIKMLGESDVSDFSLSSEEINLPDQHENRSQSTSQRKTSQEIESTNTYGTSVWGGGSSKAASSLNPGNAHGGTGKSSLVSVTDWDSDEDLNLDDL